MSDLGRVPDTLCEVLSRSSSSKSTESCSGMNTRVFSLLVCCCVASQLVIADEKIPHLVQSGDATQLIVDEKPFLMIAGELHNSSASTLQYMTPIIPKLKAMNLNTVLATVAWEQFEPEEGQFDYTLIDGLIQEARTNELKLVILWFASWKNGQSSYAPMWVKRDTERFWRVQTKEGRNTETLSPFCQATRRADAKAFAELMKRIKAIDHDSTVIMVQPENEVGILQDMDYHPEALEALQGEVPVTLIEYLDAHKNSLNPYVQEAWASHEYAKAGSWFEVFGDTPRTREFFMAWQIASYVESVALAGQNELALPMFVNAWIVQEPGDLPGTYPNGGPVDRVMDVYKAAAPSLFTLCPDIYLPDFKDICRQYVRNDNPLLIPESTVDAGRAFYAFAEHDAICYSPFGIDQRALHDHAFQQAYGVLNELSELILAYQGTGKMHGFLREQEETSRRVVMDDYSVEVVYEKKNEPCYGLIIQTSDHEFLVAGVNLRVEFDSTDQSRTGYIGQVWEGRYEQGEWIPTRMLNGDETYHNEALRVFGREKTIGRVGSPQHKLGPQPEVGQSDVTSSFRASRVKSPGIYRVLTYMRD